MMNEIETPNEFDDLEEYEYDTPFTEIMCDALAPKIKQFLLEYFGEPYYNLQPETFLEIEKIIKETFYLNDTIPDDLYRNRTILDSAKFDEALEIFIPPETPRVWKEYKYWFHQDFNDKDEDEDTFLEDSDPIDLTEEQINAKNLIHHIDDSLSFYQFFAHYLKTGYEVLIKEFHLFLEGRASFDLEILSPKGFDKLESSLYYIIVPLLEDLEAIIREDLNMNTD